jgi:hypothetical protein
MRTLSTEEVDGMVSRRLTLFATLVALSLCYLTPAYAQVSPPLIDDTLDPGESLVVTKTVVVPAAPQVADVYFLADTTGSMEDTIRTVRDDSASIIATIKARIADVQFGAGQYKDFPIPLNDFAFQNDAPIGPDDGVGNNYDASDAIAAWTVGGGNDGSEGQLYALDQIADGTGIGWRPDASRILVWFGDAPGHDPICAAISGLGFNITEASVTTKLQGPPNIAVVAISVTSGFGLDSDPTIAAGDYEEICIVGGSAEQATRITTATNGDHLVGVPPTDIVDAILDGIEQVTFDVTGEPVGCDPLDISLVPPVHANVVGPTTVGFEESISVPADAEPGVVDCQVVFRANDAPITDGVQNISIEIPPQCGDGEVDFGEDCDPGEDLVGDCCSSTCQYEPENDPCDLEGNPCTLDTCNSSGVCLAGSLRDCPSDQCYIGFCDVNTGDCERDVLPLPRDCDLDDNRCTLDSCNALGDCVAGSLRDCPDDECNLGVCIPSTGDCDLDPRDDYTPCPDDVFCDGAEYCLAGVCFEPGDPCPGPDGDPECFESCNETPPGCTAYDGDDEPCNDEASCTVGQDECLAGVCQGTTYDHDFCDDDLFCSGEETCDPLADGSDPSSGCVPGTPPSPPGPPQEPPMVCREDPVVHDPTALRPGWPEGIEVTGTGEGHVACVAAEERGLHIYDLGTTATPEHLTSYVPADCPDRGAEPDFIFDAVTMSGRTAYVAAGLCGLLIVDVGPVLRDPPGTRPPSFLGRADTQGWAKDVKVRVIDDQTIAYVADYWTGLRVINVSNPEAPVLQGALPVSEDAPGPGVIFGRPLSVHVERVGDQILLYVSTTRAFVVVDGSVGVPHVLGSTNTKLVPPGALFDPEVDIPQDVVAVGDFAYVPIWTGGLLVVDVEPVRRDPPQDPVVIQEVGIPETFFKVAAGGTNVYVTEGQCDLRVFGRTEAGLLAEAFFETQENPIMLGGGDGQCPDSDPDHPYFSWNVDQADGWVFATSGLWGPPRERQGSFQSIDFRHEGAGGTAGSRGSYPCGLGAELALLLPLLAVWRRFRGHSRHR